ncbi:hypothetical protein D9758_010869 [Tetrapyrgos nigripes]|uniref:Uncharacterized protein n=1 Tax=Tetrapyrgos nigripes TaxID=182062 RepID=A0A8H5GIR7_9AGAR|nr:hypothetical protein D9758_010869 [Tetrapyrgos nigripes]
MPDVCQGCNKIYDRLQLHLRRTTDPLCRAYADMLNQKHSDPSSEATSQFLHQFGASSHRHTLHPDSEGDFFGDYNQLDEFVDVASGTGDAIIVNDNSDIFGDAPDVIKDLEDDDWDDEDAAAAAECEHDWEAELEREEEYWVSVENGMVPDLPEMDVDNSELPNSRPPPLNQPNTL